MSQESMSKWVKKSKKRQELPQLKVNIALKGNKKETMLLFLEDIIVDPNISRP